MKRKFKVGLVSVKQGDGCPPGGIVSLGTYLRSRLPDDVDVRIIDQSFDNVENEIGNGNFDLIGISAMSIHYGRALRLARAIKTDINIPIVIGGVHISTLPDSFEDCFDLGVIGEGEETMLEVIRLYLDNKPSRAEDLLKIKGIIFWDGEEIVKTSQRPLIENLDDIPRPDWSLVDKRYFVNTALTTWGEFGVAGNILTSRGCPYKCAFCSSTQFWQRMRFHSPEYVLGQIRDIVDKYKASHIQIWDDLFTINRPRLLKIAELLKKDELLKKVRFDCQPRPNLVDDELCEILKAMNVKIVMFGFETGSEKVLKFLKHGTVTVEDNKKAIQCCRRHGFEVQGSVVLGSPGETLEDMRQTLDFVDFALKNRVQRIWAFVLTPFPNTQIWEIAKLRGRIKEKELDWDLLSLQNTDRPLLLDDEIQLESFQKIFDKIRKKTIRFRWNKIISFICNNPFRTFVYMLKSPFKTIWLLFTKNDV